jgi:signal transduction histidine kinase
LEVINGVLDLAKADAQSKELKRGMTDLSLLVHGARRHVDAVCEDAGRVQWPTVPGQLRLEGDPARLEQCLGMAVELVVRLTARGRGGLRLEVDTCSFRGAPGIQLVIREDGPGVTAELLEAIELGSSPDARATMSLLLIRRVIALHLGEFSLVSEVGRGLTARVVLPQSQPVVAPSPVVSPAAAADRSQS